MQLNVRRCSDMKNSTSNIQSIFEANGTRYIDMTVMEGKTYDQVQEDSLYDLLRRIKTITEVIADYHKNGLLHLDIKPENILSIPETVEMVQMFDYDSVTPKKEVIHSASLSYTQSWAAQEQILPNRRNRICEATDLFAIGEILFYKLMGRHSESHERRSFASYRFDYSADIFAGVNPRVFGLLEDILRHTICNKCADRYQTASELLEKLTDAIELADPRKPFLQHHLPSKSAYFIGRDAQLQEIADRLKHTDKLFISGMGGMGKSELVKQYAHAYQDAYDAVIFAVCNTDLESMILDDSMLPIGNVQQWPDEKAQEYYTRKLKELQKLCNKRILIIVDNFNDLQDEALNTLLRLNCKILFTTRCDVTEYNYAQMHLGTMAEEYVWDLFCNWYARQPVDEERMYVRQIIDLYQGHTMAVELIAKQMKASHIGPKQMLDKLGAGGFRIGGRERVIHAKDGMHPKLNIHDHIRRLFDVSELNDEQVYILANLSLMPPSGISAELFHDWCQLDGYEDINELAESGWLRQDPEATMISLHPVIADVMLDKLGEDISICREMLTIVNSSIQDDAFGDLPYEQRRSSIFIANSICNKVCRLNAFPEFIIDFIDTTALFFYNYGFIESNLSYLKKALHACQATSGEQSSTVAMLYDTLGIIYTDIDRFYDAEECLQKALEIKVNIFGEVHDETAITYSSLAKLYLAVDCIQDAEESYFKALRIRKELNEGCSDNIATLYNDLGLLFAESGRFQEALTYYNDALKIRTELHEEGSRHTILLYSNLAGLYLEIGNPQKAIDLMQKACCACSNIHGEQHTDVALIYDNMGVILQDLGQFEESKTYHLKALEIRTSIYGKAHSSVAASLDNIGVLAEELGEFEEAEKYMMEALRIRERIFGDSHTATATSYNNLGALYSESGFYEKAEQMYHHALQIRKAIFGEKHPDTASSYSNLSLLFEELGDLENAEFYCKHALEIRMELFGEKHPDVALSYNNLGGLYYRFGKFDEAQEMIVMALEQYKSLYGSEHQLIATCYNNLAFISNRRGELDDAERLYGNALSMRKNLFGENHPDVASVYNDLGSLYCEKKQYRAAESMLRKAVDIRLRLLGTKNSDTATSYNELGEVLGKLGKNKEAISCFLKVVEIHEAISGAYHPDTARGYNNLSTAYITLEDYVQAAKYLNKSLELMMHNFGRNHEDTAAVYRNLGVLYHNQALYNDAVEAYKNALEVFEATLSWTNEDTILACVDLGEAYARVGNYSSAEECYIRAQEKGVLFLGNDHETIRRIDEDLKELRKRMNS